MKSLIAASMLVMSFSTFANQGCIVRTDSLIAQEYLLEKGYAVVAKDSDKAHIDLRISSELAGSGFAKCGLIKCSTWVTNEVSVVGRLSDGIAFHQEFIDKSGKTSYTEGEGLKVNNSKLILSAVKKFEKKLQKVDCN